MYVITSCGFSKSACRAIWLSFCETVKIVLSCFPLSFSARRVFIIFSPLRMFVVWARRLVIMSGATGGVLSTT